MPKTKPRETQSHPLQHFASFHKGEIPFLGNIGVIMQRSSETVLWIKPINGIEGIDSVLDAPADRSDSIQVIEIWDASSLRNQLTNLSKIISENEVFRLMPTESAQSPHAGLKDSCSLA